MADVTIERAGPADLPAILALLAANDLPPAGLDAHLDAALVARHGEPVVGSAALELYGEVALLRSVAVAAAWRGRGLGRQLTTAALDLARARGVQRVYLLTTTAAGYFPSFGFAPIARAAIDPAVHASAEFNGACPESAAALALSLNHV